MEYIPRLQSTAAIYQLNHQCPVGDRRVRLRGCAHWQRYQFLHCSQSTSADDLEGNRVQLVPFIQVSLWNKYQIDPVWGAGLGIIYFLDSYAASDDFVKLPGFVRVDAALYLSLPKGQ
jgi:outer membrane receptor protein involved in Fe transport